MKVAHIVPTAMLNHLMLNDYHMCLVSQVLKDELYARFYRMQSNVGHTVILDNDAYEFGTSANVENIIAAMRIIQPSIVVLPDSMKADGPTNRAMAADALQVLAPLHQGGFMAVPHGKNPYQYINCATQMQYLPRVSMLGVYKNHERDLGDPRIDVIKEALSHFPVAIHLLGATDDVQELVDPYIRWRVSGIDTVRFAASGLCERVNSYNVQNYNNPTYPGRPSDYFNVRPHSFQLASSLSNITYWSNTCA